LLDSKEKSLIRISLKMTDGLDNGGLRNKMDCYDFSLR